MTPNRPDLRTSISTPEGKRRYVRRLFTTIADRYDLITVLLSYGQDQRWKRRLVSLARVRPGERALDLACGTGDLAFQTAKAGARVWGLDITPRMIAIAREKNGIGTRPHFLVGDMMSLPFPDNSFHLVTTGYGLRNVPILTDALVETARVLRPGGRLLSLDFNHPTSQPLRWLYRVYLQAVGAALGRALHGDPDTYRYIPESMRLYPDAEGVMALMRETGFSKTEYVPLIGGLMAIHRAVKA